MLYVKTPEEVLDLIQNTFSAVADVEYVPLASAIGRVLAEDIASEEYVPDFNRSTVDGYAVHAQDTFGCSEAIPAMLPVACEVLMGQAADFVLQMDACCIVPTGGALPEGADSVVMVEYT
ncbi:MAG: molybdopterin molybdenumtransferase MoeA, partial [Peptococcaceae bacterium]|nr:molybdopterin molybdenumtransferase MoeA [Peptococcaceae bacterium]